MERYNIEFLKDYLKIKKIRCGDFANLIGVTQSTLSNYLSGYSTINKETLNKILIYFKKDSYKQLFEEVKDEVLKYKKEKEENSKKYDISCIRGLLINRKITESDFAKIIHVSQTNISKYLLGKTLVRHDIFKIILNYLNVETEEEFKKICEIESQMFNIEYLEDYLKSKKISKVKFAEYLDIDVVTLNKYLNKGVRVTYNMFNKILKFFEMESESQLINDVKKKVEFYEKINTKYMHNLKNIMIKNGIMLIEVADAINMSKSTFTNCFNGLNPVSVEEFNKMITYLNNEKEISISYEDLEEKTEIKKDKYDISFFKKYITNIGQTYTEFGNIINSSQRSVCGYLNGHKVNVRKLKLLLDYYKEESYTSLKDNISIITNINSENIVEYAILSLVFDKESNIENRIDKLSEILKIDKCFILEKYKEYLQMYKESLELSNTNEIVKKIRELK